MPTIMLAIFSAILLISTPCTAAAAPLKTFVAEFNVAGVQNREELKVTLPGLLASRLNPDLVQLVEKPDQAELLLNGSYALFGKMFSVDVLLKNSLTGTISKVYEQGENQDDLLPAFGRLAQKLDRELARIQPVAAPPVVPVAAVLTTKSAAKVDVPAVANMVETPVAKAGEGYVVKSNVPALNTPGSWSSAPLEGVFSSIALGRILPDGDREIFVAGGQSIRYLLKGSELKEVAAVTIPVSAKIIAIDSADLDKDGVPEIYVSIIDRKTVSSRVYQPAPGGLELIAENQPWLYRGFGLELKDRMVLVQTVASTGDYQSGVAELSKSGRSFKAGKSRNLPGHANIFSSTRFRDAAGVEKWIVIDEDGYLIISAADGSDLWKSSEKFGGSETYFNYDTVAKSRAKANLYRWNFLEQRITVLADGTLIMPRNEGSLSFGNNRTFNKHTLFGLQWNGSILREAWHTRQTPSYLADYAYIPASREVVLLEVVQRAGLFGSGKSVVSINKLD